MQISVEQRDGELKRHVYCNEADKSMLPQFLVVVVAIIQVDKQLQTKVGLGRGHKHFEWVLWLYPRSLEAFECYKRSGVKFSCHLLFSSILLGQNSPYTVHSRIQKIMFCSRKSSSIVGVSNSCICITLYFCHKHIV